MSRFYITTPIYYVNALPHLGTFYTTVVADALARYHRARHGKDSAFFLTGLDEHGQKIERIAREKGIDAKTYCDQIAQGFRDVWQRAGISYDRFIRTTDADHRAAVEEMWRRLVAKGDIYAADYDGLYCVGCEEWKTEDDVVLEGGEKVCPTHRKPVERVKEKNYFFRLSAYAQRLLDWYGQTPSPIQPESRRNEVAEFVRRGLRDISVSRMSVKWGIPVPGDPAHVIYVWIDALTNYVTALGGVTDVEQQKNLGAFWAESHHLIAKDILRFHAVYWPALLWSAGLPAPKEVFCHGYLTVKGQKISKSMPATRVDPNAIADELGVDPLRYFVLREYTLGGDGDFTYEALFQRYESDLGNDLGNLLNRTVSMAHRYVAGTVAPSTAKPDVALAARAHVDRAEQAWENFAPSRALEATWQLVRDFNGYIEATKPWALAKDPARRDELELMLASCCEALRWAAMLVAPAMPGASKEILRQLGRAADEGHWPVEWGWPGGALAAATPVFPRVDADKQAALINKWVPGETATPGAASVAGPTSGPGAARATAAPIAAGEIAFDDFAKVDLRVAKILACERVPRADKLLKLTLDVGDEQRTVVSGIATAYQPDQLIGLKVVYLANLRPAKIRGVVSQGMILAAGDDDVLGLSTVDRDVPPGTRVR